MYKIAYSTAERKNSKLEFDSLKILKLFPRREIETGAFECSLFIKNLYAGES